MLIYQKTDAPGETTEQNKLNIMINSSAPPTEEGQTADIVLEKTIVGEEPNTRSIVSANFGPNINSFNITTVDEGETPSSVTYTENKITISRLNAALNSDVPVTTKIELPLTVVSSVAAATGDNNNGKITVVTNGTSNTFQIPGLGTAAYQNTDYFLAAGATAVNASSLGGQSPAYYAQASSIEKYHAGTGIALETHAGHDNEYLINLDASYIDGTLDDEDNKLATQSTVQSAIPAEYIKSATINDSTLALTAQNNTTINYTLPIEIRPKNLILFPATGATTDNNTMYSNDSAFNTLLGKGNYLDGGDGYKANTENLVFGGKNTLYNGVQDSATFGYRNQVYANQAMTHGYKNTNKGSESFMIGSENQLLGSITIDDTPDPETGGFDGASSDTKGSIVVGNKNVIQHGFKYGIVIGHQNTADSNCQQSNVFGRENTLGKKCNRVNAFGEGNEIKDYVAHSTAIGYQNKIYGGADGSPTQYVHILGRNNNNRGPGDTVRSNVFLIGEYLNATKEQQVVVGCCNEGGNEEANAFFVVGTGALGSPNTPKTTFMVEDGNVKVKGTLTIGSTSLSEAQLQSLLAIINSSSNSGSGSNSGSDSNYDHNWGGDATPEVS